MYSVHLYIHLCFNDPFFLFNIELKQTAAAPEFSTQTLTLYNASSNNNAYDSKHQLMTKVKIQAFLI